MTRAPKLASWFSNDAFPEALALRIPCPGVAHRRGETCLVCDENSEGTIEVLLTEADIAVLENAAQGVRSDEPLARRLRKLGLLSGLDGSTAPTSAGMNALARWRGAVA